MADARRDPSQDADLARAQGLSGLFQAVAREKLDQITSEVARELLEAPGEWDPEVLVKKEIGNRFSHLSAEQTDLLCSCVLGEIASVADLRMQLMMERRAKLISTLSNILRTVSTSEDALVRNIK